MSGIKSAKQFLSSRIGGEWSADVPPQLEHGVSAHATAFAEGSEIPHNPADIVSSYTLHTQPLSVAHALQDALLKRFGITSDIVSLTEESASLRVTSHMYDVMRDDTDFMRETNPNNHGSRRRHEAAPTSLLAQAYTAAGIELPIRRGH